MTETGRRTAAGGRRLSPTAVIAALLPLLTVGALALVQPDPTGSLAQPADQVRPDRVDLVCPAPLDRPRLGVAAAGGEVEGGVTLRGPGAQEPEGVDLRPDSVSTPASDGVAFLRGTGPVAAELIAARWEERGLAASECPTPRPEYWFTGVGAGAEHASVLELSNPDDGPAVADVTVWGRTGPVDAPRVRGLIVPGGETTRVDLTSELPRRGELALHVAVSRGRLVAAVEDEIPALGARPATRGWLPPVTEPSTDQLLLGLVPGQGTDTLALGNPGTAEARVELRVVTDSASFVPEGQQEVRVAPGSVETVTLSDLLRRQVAEGALGLQVVATEPVTAALRSVVAGDLGHAPVVTGSESPMTALVPPGDTRLVLARAGGAGVAVVAAYGPDGLLEEKRVELREGSGARVRLPEGTRLVRVTPRRTDVAAAVVVTGRGHTVVPLRELVRYALVPAVRPGLP